MPHIYSYSTRLCPLSSPASLLATHHRLFFPCHLPNQNHAHISLCWGGDAVTLLQNTFFISFSLCQLSFASLHGDRQPIPALVRWRVRSAGVVYYLRSSVITTVHSVSYWPDCFPTSSLRHPHTSAPLCRPLPFLVALNIFRVSTCFHCLRRLHRLGISSAHRPYCCCCPIARVCVCLSSATISILV